MIVLVIALLGGGYFFGKHQVTAPQNRGFPALNFGRSVSFALILKVFCFTGSGVVALP